MLRLLLRVLASAVAIVLAIAVGLVAFVYHEARQVSPAAPEYVALGSSYGSGPGLKPRARHSAIFCAQSDNNYAHQLARRLNLSLVDRTCAGATTQHVLHGGQFFQDAQIQAVDRRTRLVTVTIGGNDVFYLANLVAESCDRRTPLLWRTLGACKVKSRANVETGFDHLETDLSQIVAVLHQRAPLARLILVDYLTVVPQTGTCARLGLDDRQAEAMRAVARRLQEATRKAAAGRAILLDAAWLSRNHDVCSADPWIAGAHPSPHAAPLHPNLEGMTAVAQALDPLAASSALPASASDMHH